MLLFRYKKKQRYSVQVGQTHQKISYYVYIDYYAQNLMFYDVKCVIHFTFLHNDHDSIEEFQLSINKNISVIVTITRNGCGALARCL